MILEEALKDGYQRVAQVALDCQKYDEALDFSQRSLEFDPCSQAGHLLAIHAYLGAGRPEQGLRQFEKCERILAQELDMEPSIELLEAYQRAKLSL